MKKIKLAMLANDLNMNGISNVVMSYCKELDKKKFEIHIIAGTPVNSAYRSEAEQNKITIWELSSRKQESKRYYWGLWQVLKKEKFDIVHVHGNSATMTAELFLAWLSKTHIRVAHSHNTTCSNLKIHNMLYPVFSLLYTAGFACSEAAGKWLFRDKMFTIIPNGFNTEKFIFNRKDRCVIREEQHIKGTDFVIGHIGRFNPQKNHEFLLKVFEKVADIKSDAWLLLVGDGPDFKRINQLIQKHRYRDQIIVYGETKDTPKMYSAMDVFVFPSKFEGLGIAAVEAQMNGLPVIASDCVPSEANINNRMKFLSLQCDPDLWAREIVEAAKVDRKQFYEDNIEKISSYNIAKNSINLEECYKEMMREK